MTTTQKLINILPIKPKFKIGDSFFYCSCNEKVSKLTIKGIVIRGINNKIKFNYLANSTFRICNEVIGETRYTEQELSEELEGKDFFKTRAKAQAEKRKREIRHAKNSISWHKKEITKEKQKLNS